MTNMIPYRNGNLGMTSLFGWDPFRLIDNLLDGNSVRGEVVWNAMPVRVKTDEDNVYLTIDLPGVDEQDVELAFERGHLTISAKRDERSYSYGATLGVDIDPESIVANLDKGVLSVKASKKPEAKPRKIALAGSQKKSLESGEEK